MRTIMIMLVAMLMSVAANAQKESYKLVNTSMLEIATSPNGAGKSAVAVTPKHSLNVFTLAADSVEVSLSATAVLHPGYRLTFIVQADTTATVKFGDKLSGADKTVNKTKTYTYDFISNGSAWFMISNDSIQ